MEAGIYSIVIILFIIGFIFLMRAIGAWMLRINEVINAQKETNELLKTILKELRNNELKSNEKNNQQ